MCLETDFENIGPLLNENSKTKIWVNTIKLPRVDIEGTVDS